MRTLLLAFAIAATVFAQANYAPVPDDRDMDSVRAQVMTLKETVETAYLELLDETPGASGELEVSFSIARDGAVSEIEVVPTEGLEPLVETVSEAVAALEFEECEGQREELLPVTIPFTLNPSWND